MQEASSWCENSFHSFTYYLRQGGVMRSGRFVCYSVCVYRITAKVVSRFHWNLFVTIESSNRKNRLIFWWWSRIRIPDQFSTSLTIAEQGILGDLLAFLIQSQPIFTTLGEMIDASKILNPQHFGSDPNPEDSNPGSLSVEVRRLGGGLRSPSTA